MKFKRTAKFSLGMAVTCFALFFSLNFARAQTPFGGLATASVPCTCAAGAFTWFTFTPLFLGTVPVVGALVAPPAIAFPVYRIVPGSWALGFFTPGAGTFCSIGAYPYCFPLPNYGLILPATGSSPPTGGVGGI